MTKKESVSSLGSKLKTTKTYSSEEKHTIIIDINHIIFDKKYIIVSEKHLGKSENLLTLIYENR
jgi:hypothetical protein